MWCERDRCWTTAFFVAAAIAVAAGVLVAYIDYTFR